MATPEPPSIEAERRRVREADEAQIPWRRWGPYLSERAWGTVREDYSANGDAWSYLSFDQAASRTFRWSEDGLGGVCDDQQHVCMALALWNGQDPILKERAFGLTGEQGNHGEDVKDCWWYLDATPTSSWLRWRFHYPQARFPYEELIGENERRSRLEPEYELMDTGIFDEGRYWAVTVTWAKDGPEDLLWQIEVTNHGPEAATLDVLPTLWFRNRWRWEPSLPVPRLTAGSGGDASILVDEPTLGRYVLQAGAGPDGQAPHLLFCDNETNASKLWGPGASNISPFPKDGIADHVLHGAATVNPEGTGTKAAAWYHLEVAAGATAKVRLRFAAGAAGDLDAGFDAALAQRALEADEFYAGITPTDASADEALVLRQGAAGMLWSKQYYHYDVERWLDGDPGEPTPPPSRRQGRNATWFHLSNADVISMPDPWEYPWYAAWDLAFHTVALAHLDPEFAKAQLLLLCREWYMHPNGQLPAYEWNFGDVNPPVHAWAAMSVYRIDSAIRAAEGRPPDNDFLERLFHKLLINFTWWVNRKDEEDNNVFEGGFLGLDNIGLFDRSKPLPVPGHLEQSDGTAWMAMYCLSLLEMALRLADSDPTYEDVATKFYEHFTYIASAMKTQGLWDEDDGFFYDVMHLADDTRVPVRVRSMVGVVPLLAVTTIHPDLLAKLPGFAERITWFEKYRTQFASCIAHTRALGADDRRLLSIVDGPNLARVLTRVLDSEELLSPYGIRSVSRYHRDHPFTLVVGGQSATVDYEPAESTNYLFGGNSNWRGPVWMPLNYLLIEALRRFERYFDGALTVEMPTGSGAACSLGQVAEQLSARLVGLFLRGPDGKRPVHGERQLQQDDPAWRDLLWFHEYFHGDTGAGLGASHQTGWTGLVVDLIASRRLDPPG
jgi:hypothetical protein